MAGIVAVVLFVLAFVLHGSKAVMPVWIDPTALSYLGLAFLALHVTGVPTWPGRRQS